MQMNVHPGQYSSGSECVSGLYVYLLYYYCHQRRNRYHCRYLLRRIHLVHDMFFIRFACTTYAQAITTLCRDRLPAIKYYHGTYYKDEFLLRSRGVGHVKQKGLQRPLR